MKVCNKKLNSSKIELLLYFIASNWRTPFGAYGKSDGCRIALNREVLKKKQLLTNNFCFRSQNICWIYN